MARNDRYIELVREIRVCNIHHSFAVDVKTAKLEFEKVLESWGLNEDDMSMIRMGEYVDNGINGSNRKGDGRRIKEGCGQVGRI